MEKNPVNQRIEQVAKFVKITVRTFASCASDNNAVHRMELPLTKRQVTEAVARLVCAGIRSEVEIVGKMADKINESDVLFRNEDVKRLCVRTIDLVSARGAKSENIRSYKFHNIDVKAAGVLFWYRGWHAA